MQASARRLVVQPYSRPQRALRRATAMVDAILYVVGVVETKGAVIMETERISRKTFNSLPEYSMSNPTGTFVGKVWKRRVDPYDDSSGWLICEYVEINEPGMIGINYRRPEIIEPGEPA